MMNDTVDLTLNEAYELAEQTRLRATEDFKEGVKATEERRVPNFRGR